MDTSLGLMLLLQVILIFSNAVFASAEIAFLSVNEAKIQKMAHSGDKKAARLAKFSDDPARFLSTIQVAITLSGFLGSAFAAENFSGPIVDWVISLGVGIPRASLDALAVILITLILSYFTLVFGELVPKRVAMKRAEKLALGMSGPISFVAKICTPLIWLLTKSTNAVLRIMGIDPSEEEQPVGEEDIRLMVEAGSESGSIHSEEKEFIQNVFEFDDIDAGDIATHRKEVDMLYLEDSESQWDELIHSTRHSFYPVCSDSADNIVGMLNAKDYFRLKEKSRRSVMENAVKPAYFVPETIKADQLFRNMRRSRSSIAVVLDEYAGVVGIVTINDLVEQLVGDLGNDEDAEIADEPKIRKADDALWEIEGNPELCDIEDSIGVKFKNTDSDTLTGLVFEGLELIPDDGKQEICIERDGCEISVQLIQNHVVERASIRLLSAR